MNLPAQGWEIYYSNGTVFSSADGSWADAPQDNVIIVLIWHGYHVLGVRQKTQLVGHDYYYYVTDELWGSTDDYGIVQGKEFKRGVWVEDGTMDEIMRLAFEKLDM